MEASTGCALGQYWATLVPCSEVQEQLALFERARRVVCKWCEEEGDDSIPISSIRMLEVFM